MAMIGGHGRGRGVRTARAFEDALGMALEALASTDLEAVESDDAVHEAAAGLREARIDTFENAGLLTSDRGLVVTLGNGAAFQITIVQSADAEGEDSEDEDDSDDSE